MPLAEALLLALSSIWTNQLRSFPTLPRIIVSATFLAGALAVIAGTSAAGASVAVGVVCGIFPRSPWR